MKEFIERILTFFGKKPKKETVEAPKTEVVVVKEPEVIKETPVVEAPKIEEPKVEAPKVEIEKIPLDFGFIVGHNINAQGANNYLGESEWIFGKRIATKAIAKLEALNYSNVYMLLRPDGDYNRQVSHIVHQVTELKIKNTLELHFNSASGRALGVETLISQSATEEDNKAAILFADLLSKKYNFNFKERADNGVFTVDKNHNGAGMLYAISRAGAVAILVEPCFANYRNPESIAIFENEDFYVDVLVETAIFMGKTK